MKKIQLIFIALCLLTFSVTGQEQIRAEKKVTFNEDGRIFINREQGVYLWISHSPDENSKKVRLQSDSSTRYTNPMYFDTEGYNTVRSPSAVDTTRKRIIYPLRDIIFEVYADGKAPKTNAKFIYSNLVLADGKTYYKGDVKVVLQSRDQISGLEKIYYSNKKESYKEYLDTIKYTEEGLMALNYYGVDKVGNIEDPFNKEFTIDNSPPKSNYEIVGDFSKNYVSPNSSIKLNSNDSLIGVRALYFSINNGTYKIYRNPIPVKWLGKEPGLLSFYSVDKLGNKEAVKHIGRKGSKVGTENNNLLYEFDIDTEPPSVSIELEGSQTIGKNIYIPAKGNHNIKATDNKSGINKIMYSINNPDVDREYKEVLEFKDEGLVKIRFYASDLVGNTSETRTETVYVDATAPDSKVELLGVSKEVNDQLYISSKTTIKIDAQDKVSGVKEINYSLENKEPVSYTSPFTINEDGEFKVTYWSGDNVGNIEEQGSIEVIVDNTPPQIEHYFSVVAASGDSVLNPQQKVFPNNVLLHVSANDKGSGSTELKYKINNGEPSSDMPITNFSPGLHKVEVTAIDLLGNKKSEIIEFSLKE